MYFFFNIIRKESAEVQLAQIANLINGTVAVVQLQGIFAETKKCRKQKLRVFAEVVIREEVARPPEAAEKTPVFSIRSIRIPADWKRRTESDSE